MLILGMGFESEAVEVDERWYGSEEMPVEGFSTTTESDVPFPVFPPPFSLSPLTGFTDPLLSLACFPLTNLVFFDFS